MALAVLVALASLGVFVLVFAGRAASSARFNRALHAQAPGRALTLSPVRVDRPAEASRRARGAAGRAS